MNLADSILSIVASLLTIYLAIGMSKRGATGEDQPRPDKSLHTRHYAFGCALGLATAANLMAWLGDEPAFYNWSTPIALFTMIAAVSCMLGAGSKDEADPAFYSAVIFVAGVYFMLGAYNTAL